MSIIEELASSLGRKDELPNQELAEKIVNAKNSKAIEELVVLLKHKDKNIQSDAIKILYEAGERSPAMISPFYKEFVSLLISKNNRLVWGAITALDSITETIPKEIYANITVILEAADKASVIAKDHAVSILIKLATVKAYSEDATTLLLDMLQQSLPNQLPMYAEIAMPVINKKYEADFIRILSSRLEDMEKESKRKRLEKVIKKFK